MLFLLFWKLLRPVKCVCKIPNDYFILIEGVIFVIIFKKTIFRPGRFLFKGINNILTEELPRIIFNNKLLTIKTILERLKRGLRLALPIIDGFNSSGFVKKVP